MTPSSSAGAQVFSLFLYPLLVWQFGYGIIGSLYFNSELDLAGADIDNLTFTSVPEPASLLLLGSGLFGLAGAIRRKLSL